MKYFLPKICRPILPALQAENWIHTAQ